MVTPPSYPTLNPVLICTKTIRAKEDPAICDFREENYYEVDCFGDILSLSAHDGEVYSYQYDSWKSNFSVVNATRNTLIDMYYKAKLRGGIEYVDMSSYELAGGFLNVFRGVTTDEMIQVLKNKNTFSLFQDNNTLEEVLYILENAELLESKITALSSCMGIDSSKITQQNGSYRWFEFEHKVARVLTEEERKEEALAAIQDVWYDWSYTTTDLAEVTGKPVEFFSPFANENSIVSIEGHLEDLNQVICSTCGKKQFFEFFWNKYKEAGIVGELLGGNEKKEIQIDNLYIYLW